MRISCPNCHALYEVPSQSFGGRPRRLRCEQCGHGWHVAPDGQGQAEETAIAAAPVSEPPFAAEASQELSPEMDEALHRRFGEAADAEAQAEMQAALQDEVLAHQHEDAVPPPVASEGEGTEADRFANLVRAARNNAVELEPGAARRARARGANPRLVTLLVVLLILALIVVERHAVIRMIPASAKLFHALHLY